MAANIQKIPLKAKRMGKKVALSGNFNIFRATLSAQIGHGMTEKGICEVQSGFFIRLSFCIKKVISAYIFTNRKYFSYYLHKIIKLLSYIENNV